MKFASDTTVKILEKALGREEETRDFYKSCLEKATINGTKIVLKSLIQDEERHVAIVSDMMKKAASHSDAGSINTGESVPAVEVFELAFPHGLATESGFDAESATVGEMLKKALENEKESFDNYAKAAKETEEKDAGEIFSKLAAEEKKHYILIDNLVNYLGEPGEWLYSEENILFNL